jgi:hypothetical protein
LANPAFLLTSPTHDGTLAAARCLGRLGIPVTMAGSRLELSAAGTLVEVRHALGERAFGTGADPALGMAAGLRPAQSWPCPLPDVR